MTPFDFESLEGAPDTIGYAIAGPGRDSRNTKDSEPPTPDYDADAYFDSEGFLTLTAGDDEWITSDCGVTAEAAPDELPDAYDRGAARPGQIIQCWNCQRPIYRGDAVRGNGIRTDELFCESCGRPEEEGSQ